MRTRGSALRRVIFGGILVVLILGSFAAEAGLGLALHTLPQTTGTITFSGLSAPVSVLRDQWGVPHITGATLHDVAFAQGYVTAQDRLFQMEVNRRVAQGRLAELFGAGPDDSLIAADKFLRTLNLYGSAQAEAAELALLNPQVFGELQAYADGVNAFLASHNGGVPSLPPEFTILDDTPAPWTVLDTLAYGRVVALSLDNQWYIKYTRAMVLAKLGPAATAQLFPPYPAGNPILFTADGAAAPVSVGVQASTRSTTTSGEALLAAVTPAEQSAFARLSGDVLRGAAVVHQLLGGVSDALGSNDWVVDGTKTVTGMPLLANDPHLGINMPSIWYEVGLRGGGLDVIGFTFPGVPGVIIGHNDHIAWGVTNVGADDTDLYLEKLDPSGHPGMYEYNGQWLPLQTRQEVIKVRGGSPVTFTVSVTQHGPLLNSVVDDLKSYPPIALKWTALQPDYSFAGFFELDDAVNWTQFQAAVEQISISQNFVYADTEGHIGYEMSGVLPLRNSANDLLPVDGSNPLYEWTGYLPRSQMPRLFDPPTHVIATANNEIVPDSPSLYVTSTWDQGYRARRILDLLTATLQLSIDDYRRIQADVYAIPAATLTPYFLHVGATAGGDTAKAASLLQGWDFELTRSSAAAAVYEVTVGNLLRRTLEPVLGKDLYGIYRSNYSSSGLYSVLIELLTTPTAPFYGSPSARDAAIVSALAKTMSDLRAALGTDPRKWQWGTLHQAHFAHPLASVAPLSLIFGTSPVDRPGDGVTVSVGGDGGFSADPPTYDQHTVSSMREIIDLGNLDRSLWVTTTGESGEPFSRHYGDLIPLWDQNQYQAMAYSPEAESKAAVDFLDLKP